MSATSRPSACPTLLPVLPTHPPRPAPPRPAPSRPYFPHLFALPIPGPGACEHSVGAVRPRCVGRGSRRAHGAVALRRCGRIQSAADRKAARTHSRRATPESASVRQHADRRRYASSGRDAQELLTLDNGAAATNIAPDAVVLRVSSRAGSTT